MRKTKTSRTGITKKRKKTNTLYDRLPSNHGEWLELAISFTERAISRSVVSESYLLEQASRLKSELEQWRKEND